MTEATAKSEPLNATRRRLMIGAPLALLAAGTAGYHRHQSRQAEPRQLSNSGPFRTIYVTSHDDQSHVDVALIYPYGERHNPKVEGLAHYLEHLAWQNMRDAGDDGGNHSNALTSAAATAYWLSRPPADLQDMIQRLAASAAPLQITEDLAVQERDIVAREYDKRMLDDPMIQLWLKADKALFGDGPYGRSVIGTQASIGTFTFDDARDLHDASHHLATASLLIRGPVAPKDVEQAITAIETWPTPRAAALSETPSLWPAVPTPQIASETVSGIGSPQLVRRASFFLPPDFQWAEILAARDILWEMIHSSRHGSLARPLSYDAFIAHSFDFGLPTLGAAGLEMWIRATPDKDVPLSDLNAAVEENLTSILTAPDRSLFAEMINRHFSPPSETFDALERNAENLFDAKITGMPYVTFAQTLRAGKSMRYDRFQQFTQHFLTPRSAVIRMISNT